MSKAFDCGATAALLRAVGTLVWASHAGAAITAFYRAWPPLLIWLVVVYFAVRVRLDAELFDLLAADPEAAPAELDGWLERTGLRSRRGTASMEQRCQGARRLARNLVIAFAVQMAMTAWAIYRGSA